VSEFLLGQKDCKLVGYSPVTNNNSIGKTSLEVTKRGVKELRRKKRGQTEETKSQLVGPRLVQERKTLVVSAGQDYGCQ